MWIITSENSHVVICACRRLIGSHYPQQSGSRPGSVELWKVTFSTVYFTPGPSGPGVLCSSWNTLLCDRCHIKQHSRPPSTCFQNPSTVTLLWQKISAGLVLDCICLCVCVCALTNEVRVSKGQAIRDILDMCFTLKHL